MCNTYRKQSSRVVMKASGRHARFQLPSPQVHPRHFENIGGTI